MAVQAEGGAEIVRASEFEALSRSLKSIHTEASRRAALRLGKPDPLLCEEKAQALRLKSVHLDGILRSIEEGKFPDLASFNREVGLGTLVALSGMVNGLSLLADLLSIRQDCKVRPIQGKCVECQKTQEGRRDEFGVWVCKICGTRLPEPVRAPASRMKKAFRRISLAEMLGNLEIIGGGIENVHGETEEPGVLHFFRRHLEMLNVMGIKSGAFSPGEFPGLEGEEVDSESGRGPIVFVCGHCKVRLSAEASSAGKLVECPKCKSRLEVPETTEAVRQVSTQDIAELPEREAEDAILLEELE